MLNIDFSNIKNIDKKLSQSEILALNKIFSDPKIQQKLVEIEENRKIRFRNRIFIFIVACFLSFLFLFFNKPNGLNFGIFLINFIPCSLILLFVYVVWDYFINKKLTWKIEKSLKKEILPKIALSLYSEINYDHWEKYSFVSGLRFLEKNNFIEYYNSVLKNENSIQFSFKNFLVNWFKIKTAIVGWSYKSGGTRIKDYCYLTKIELPKDENFFPKLIIIKSYFSKKRMI